MADAVRPRTRGKSLTGVVVSDKMDKTVVVAVERTTKHRIYGRTMRVTRRFKAHDADNRVKTGDRVVIVEMRPLSREKRWRVAEVLGHKIVDEQPLAEEPQELAEEPQE